MCHLRSESHQTIPAFTVYCQWQCNFVDESCHPISINDESKSRKQLDWLHVHGNSIHVSCCNFAMSGLASVASTVFNIVFQVIEVIKLLSDMGLSPVEMLRHLETIIGLRETKEEKQSKYLMKMSAAKLGWDEYLAEPYLKRQLQSIGQGLSAKHEQGLNQMQCSTRESPEMNWDPVKVILLWGPPGCGKTYAARVLAGTSGHTFYELDANSVRGELVGQSEKNLQKVFKSIDDFQGKSIVFFDEADSLLRRRSSSNPYDIQLVDLFLAWTGGIRRKQLSVSSVWEVLSGNCTASRNCVMSPNFPANYDNYQHCTFQMLSPGPITVEHFQTEVDSDILTVNGHQFSGSLESRDFEDTIPAGNIDWSSDFSITRLGWKLCGHSKRATDTSLVLLLASNNKEMMDPAVTSRAVPIHIPLPSSSVRKQWWEKNAKQLGGQDWETLASATSGASFRDLSQIAETAEEEAMSSGDSVPRLQVYLDTAERNPNLVHVKASSLVLRLSGHPQTFTEFHFYIATLLALLFAFIAMFTRGCHQRSTNSSALSRQLLETSALRLSLPPAV